MMDTDVSGHLRKREGELPPTRIAAALAEVFSKWRSPDEPARMETIDRIADLWNCDRAGLSASFDALLEPFSSAALAELAENSISMDSCVVGMIVSGNIAGVGLHEFTRLLISGASLLIKTPSAEPFFYPTLAQTIAEIDAQLASRIIVAHWARTEAAATIEMMSACDCVLAFGDDKTIDSLRSFAVPVIGYGSKLSGALVLASANHLQTAALLARDTVLFEQRGCLSPHHIFVEEHAAGVAKRFAAILANEMEYLSRDFHPARTAIEVSTSKRSFVENARWRSLGGQPVELLEGKDLGWCVVYDRDATFHASPTYRALNVSPVKDSEDLRRRLAPALGYLEGFALAPSSHTGAMRAVITDVGATWVCEPGTMQSPPLTWRHGGRDIVSEVSALLSGERRRV